MPSAFLPAFGNLTDLQNLTANAADAAAGKTLQGYDNNGHFVTYQVEAGTAAQDLPGIVHPANHHADTNAVIFVQH